MADNDTVSSLADLKNLTSAAPAPAAAADTAVEGDAPVAPAAPSAPLRDREVDAFGRSYATGRRKDAVARVWLKPGSGKIVSMAAIRKCTSPVRPCAW